MTSAHLLAKLKKLHHHLHHSKPFSYGYERYEELHHKPSYTYPSHNNYESHGAVHSVANSQVNTQINVGKESHYGENVHYNEKPYNGINVGVDKAGINVGVGVGHSSVGVGVGHGGVNVGVGHKGVNVGVGVGVGHNNYYDSHNSHPIAATGGHNSFQSSHVKKEEESHHTSYNSGSDALVFQDEAKHQNNGYTSYQGSHMKEENNFQYTNSKYPTNYGYNTKYDSLNLNEHRPDEHHKKGY